MLKFPGLFSELSFAVKYLAVKKIDNLELKLHDSKDLLSKLAPQLFFILSMNVSSIRGTVLSNLELFAKLKCYLDHDRFLLQNQFIQYSLL